MQKKIEDYKRIHLIGIGGASMYAIAAMLLNDNKTITGSDLSPSLNTEYLENLGIKITIGHNPEIVQSADLVIYTAAISQDDPEIIEAKNNNIEIIERAPFLGEYTKNYNNLICISGTHGKSTTSGMLSQIFLEAGLNPTIQIGAALKKIDGNYHIGSKEYFILEACEYVDSFLNFKPTSAIVLNIDNDHLDYFKNLENIQKSFSKFTSLIPKNGYLVLNADDENSKILANNNTNITTYALNNEANIKATNIKYNDIGFPSFDVIKDKQYLTTINLKVLGNHNILNSLASLSMALNYNIDIKYIKKALEEYSGVKRRFEYLGEYKKAHIFDDFAHHPTEIKATYNSAMSINHNESWAVFQSHTYSRTKEHLEDFAKILAKFDHIIICDIYPARETNIWNVKESDLVKLIKKENNHVIHIPTYKEIAKYLKDNIHENDLVITIGAGPVNKVANILLEK